MIGEIEKFGKSLYDRESASTEDKLPPVTYVDYNAALVEHLNELKLGIVAIEREIMKQGTNCNDRSNGTYNIANQKFHSSTWRDKKNLEKNRQHLFCTMIIISKSYQQIGKQHKKVVQDIIT